MKLLSHLFKEEPPEENRVAYIEVTAEALLGLFQLDGKRILRMEGVPADACVEGMWVDDVTRTLRIGIRSKELALVTEGTAIPSINVTVYTYGTGDTITSDAIEGTDHGICGPGSADACSHA